MEFRFGLTPLITAATAGRADLVDILIAARADVCKPTRDGATALQRTIENKHVAARDRLMAYGAESCRVIDADGVGAAYFQMVGACRTEDKLGDMPGGTKDACKRVCDRMPQCVGFAYSYANWPRPGGGCTLKRSLCDLQHGECDRDPCLWMKMITPEQPKQRLNVSHVRERKLLQKVEF